jgi:tetratricopeptide (TPR) repeat protein
MSVRKKTKKKPERKSNNTGLVIIFGGLIAAGVICALMSSPQFSGPISATVHNCYDSLMTTFNKEYIPDNLTAQQYFGMGERFKDLGWVESSRKAMQKAVDASVKGGEGAKFYGYNAKIYIKCCLPKESINKDAEQENVEAANAMDGMPGPQAVALLKRTVDKYPGFEWPLGNLAALYLQDHRPDEAEPLINKALEINPNYLNGLLYKAQLKGLQGKLGECATVLKHGMDVLGPRDQLAPALAEYFDRFEEVAKALKSTRRPR